MRCAVLHRSGTNDFHGWMDDVYRTNALIPHQPLRYCWSPHLNHRLTPEVEAAMPLWFDQFLKGGPALPETPRSELVPGSDGRYVLSGFGWHRGWNDRINDKFNAEYETNMTRFIRDMRKDLGAPALPFVIAETGMSGPEETHRAPLR